MIVKIKWFCNLLIVRGILIYPLAIVNTHKDKLLRKHELIHFIQACYTGLWLWYIPYLYYHIKYGYRGNPYEVEAYVNQHNKQYYPTPLSHRRYVGKIYKRDYFRYDEDGWPVAIPKSDRIYYTE